MAYKYERLVRLLKEEIAASRHPGSYKLPTERELCSTYGLSRQTVRKALSLLEEEQLIIRRQGSGSYTAGPQHEPGSNTIAILVSCDDDYIYPALLSDIRIVLEREGFQIKIHTTHSSVAQEREILELLLAAPLCGLIAEGAKTAFPNPNQDLYQRLIEREIPVLFFHGSYSNLKNSVCIRYDDFNGGYQLGMHLIRERHTQIAGLFNADEIQGRERYYGWACAMRDMGLPGDDTHIGWFGSREYQQLRRRQDTGFLSSFISSQLWPCTAVICHNDEIAYWLSRELKDAGYQLPRQISLASFDHSYLTDLHTFPVTSLAGGKPDLAHTISSTALKMVQKKEVSSRILPWKQL